MSHCLKSQNYILIKLFNNMCSPPLAQGAGVVFFSKGKEKKRTDQKIEIMQVDERKRTKNLKEASI